MCRARACAAELERERALPRDDVRVIERRHERGAALLGDLRRDRLAVLALAVVQHDLGAECARPLELDLRRIGRHDDRCPHLQPARGERDGLRVIAGRVRHDAGVALVAR